MAEDVKACTSYEDDPQRNYICNICGKHSLHHDWGRLYTREEVLHVMDLASDKMREEAELERILDSAKPQ